MTVALGLSLPFASVTTILLFVVPRAVPIRGILPAAVPAVIQAEFVSFVVAVGVPALRYMNVDASPLFALPSFVAVVAVGALPVISPV